MTLAPAPALAPAPGASSEGRCFVLEFAPAPAAPPARPIMPVLTLPVALGDPSEGEAAGAVAAKAAGVGAHSCRLSCVAGEAGEGDLEVLVAEAPGNLGIGGKVWDAALVLVRYLRRENRLIRGQRVLELGQPFTLPTTFRCHPFSR